MSKTINVPPPTDFASFSPSELFKYFFQIGHWTEDSFSGEFQNFTRGKLISTVTINKWKNRDVIPTRYSGPFFKFIESLAEPEIARTWILAFETVWARHSSGRGKTNSGISTSVFSDKIKSQHQTWINQLYTENRKGELFSPADIYVPLQLNDVRANDLVPQDVEDIIDRLGKNLNSDADWVFISGGPGSGKSMTALHMANLISETDMFPIYIRGSRLSNIEIDISGPEQSIEDVFAIGSFLKHFRSSSFDTAILILDGLDEVHRAPHGTPNKLDQLISELKNEQTACAAHNKYLKIAAFGREAHVQFAENQVQSKASQHLALLSLDGRSRIPDVAGDTIQGQDLREVWWQKYIAATGHVIDSTLPDFLVTEYDDFSEFGSDPLLSYLICHTALGGSQDSLSKKLPHERVNELTYSVNRNEIYKTIFDRLAFGIRTVLEPKRFQSVLQHIALAIWQGENSQSVSLRSVYNSIQNTETKASFQTLGLSSLSAQTLPDTLITAFYYRLSKSETAAQESMIEFTHKSFAEYLTSTLIFDCFVQLISAVEENDNLEFALTKWVNISRKGSHTPSLADFCQKEASIRFDALSNINWDLALKIIGRHIHTGLFSSGGPPGIAEIKRSHNLLFFIWSCLNLERQKRSKAHYSLPNISADFGVADLKLMQGPSSFRFAPGTMTEPTLKDLTFLTSALSALRLSSADLSQLSFSLGHMENLDCRDTSFAMTYWSHVKVTGSTFSRSVFQQAIFHQWRIMDTRFEHCFIQGSRFQGATLSDCSFTDTFFSQCHFSDVEFNASEFENIVFDRCVFTDSRFGNHVDPDQTFKAEFRQCTFIDMDQALSQIPSENIESNMPINVAENPTLNRPEIKIQTQLEKLL